MGSSIYSHDAAEHLKSARVSKPVHHVFTKTSLNNTLDPKGVKFREARDSTEHPESSAIAVFFDVTGSMGEIPRVFAYEKLPGLMKLLLLRNYITDPQLLFGAVGDATVDRSPLQVGQFESGLEMDEHLTNIHLEGGGGGSRHESYELACYFAARHFACDCWEKRSKKPYLFTVGDEMAYEIVSKHQVRELIGDDLEDNIPFDKLVTELREKFEYFHIAVHSGSYHDGHHPWWQQQLGERALLLDHPGGVCELIGLTIGSCEGRDLEDTSKDLIDAGMDPAIVASAKRAIVPYAGSTSLRKGSVSGNLGEVSGAGESRRL